MQENPDLDVDYDSDLFHDQFSLVKRFVYHLFYYRTLHKDLQTHQVNSEFWTHTTDGHLLQATMCWCMVFGSDRNPTHWKHLSPKNSKKIQASFRAGVVSHTGLTWEEWERYWTKMKNFRDTYAAHRETDPHDPVPNFDMALQVAYYYDDWLRRVLWEGYSLEGKGRIYGSVFDEPPLRETWEMLEEQTTPLINSCIKQTKDFTGRRDLHKGRFLYECP